MLFILLFVACFFAAHIAMEIYVGKEDGFLLAFKKLKEHTKGILGRINTKF